MGSMRAGPLQDSRLRPRGCLTACAGLFLLAACDSGPDPDEGSAPSLLEALFVYDVTAMPGFTPKSASWNGDTLTLFDYWALTDQPVLRGRAEWEEGELAVSYEAASSIANDWMPSVETRLRILVPEGEGAGKIRLRAMPKARKPSASEASLGVQDATADRVLALPRP